MVLNLLALEHNLISNPGRSEYKTGTLILKASNGGIFVGPNMLA